MEYTQRQRVLFEKNWNPGVVGLVAGDEQRRLAVAVVDDRVVRQRIKRGAVGREQEAQRAGQNAQLDAQREAGTGRELRARHHIRTYVLRARASAA